MMARRVSVLSLEKDVSKYFKLFNLRFQNATGQLDNIARIPQVRKDVARIETLLREREIVACLARGESNKEIARRLDVAESTVKIHVQSILKKLNLTSRVQVAVYAVEHGLNL